MEPKLVFLALVGLFAGVPIGYVVDPPTAGIVTVVCLMVIVILLLDANRRGPDRMQELLKELEERVRLNPAQPALYNTVPIPHERSLTRR